MQQQIKTIEKAIKELIEENKDFVDLFYALRDRLNDKSNDKNEINNKKIKLLNYLLKNSKRKSLFKIKILGESKYDMDRDVEVGLNSKGVGISEGYENNFRNIMDYWARDKFLKYLKRIDFKEKIIENIPQKDKKNLSIIKKILKIVHNEKDKTERKVMLKNGIEISINNDNVYISHKKRGIYSGSISVLQIELKEYGKKDLLSEVGDLDVNVSLTDLQELSYLSKYKEGIMPILKTELDSINSDEKETKDKLKILNDELASFEALEKL